VSQLARTQHDLLRWWADNGSEFLNGRLRAGDQLTWERDMHEALMALARPAGETAELAVLWRGTRLPAQWIAEGAWIDPGWTSASRSRKIGDKFAGKSRRRSSFALPGMLARLVVRDDVLVADLEGAFADHQIPSALRVEREVVIAPGARYRICGRDDDGTVVWQVTRGEQEPIAA
jgi:hypothetical protein